MIEGVREIAVLRALGGIGDVLCVVPALARLRAAAPEARISYIGLRQVEGVVARYRGLVDRFIAFPGFPGVPEHPFDAARLTDWLAERQREPALDLVIQLHGSGSVTNVFAALLGGKRTVGYHIPGLWSPDGASPDFNDSRSEVDRWTGLIDSIAKTQVDDLIAFPITDGERASARALLPATRYAVVHAGASDPRRRWPADRFAAVADALAAQGLAVVLTGTPNEAAVTDDVATAMQTSALNFCGRTTLGQAAALIEEAEIVVTNDTGTSHLAAALRSPSIVIFIASDPARWAPADTARHSAVGQGVDDVPVGSKVIARAASFPDVAEVLAAVTRLTAAPRKAAA